MLILFNIKFLPKHKLHISHRFSFNKVFCRTKLLVVKSTYLLCTKSQLAVDWLTRSCELLYFEYFCSVPNIQTPRYHPIDWETWYKKGLFVSLLRKSEINKKVLLCKLGESETCKFTITDTIVYPLMYINIKIKWKIYVYE